jgi:hypothetical protein
MLPLTRRGSGLGDFVKVDCASCHHVALALVRVGLSPAVRVLDLKERFRCRRWEEGAGGGRFDQVEGPNG